MQLEAGTITDRCTAIITTHHH